MKTIILFRFLIETFGKEIRGLWIPEQMSGGLEDEQVRRINKQLLENGRNQELDKAIREIPVGVIKEPRFATLGNPILIQTWYAVRPEIKLLVVKRNFHDVGCSLHSSKGIKPIGDTPEEAAKIVGEGYNALLAEIKRLEIPYEQLEFPDFCDQRDHVLDVLQEFGLLQFRPDSEVISRYKCSMGTPTAVWDQWFDSSKARVYRRNDTIS
jgi:hypothetical protein